MKIAFQYKTHKFPKKYFLDAGKFYQFSLRMLFSKKKVAFRDFSFTVSFTKRV